MTININIWEIDEEEFEDGWGIYLFCIAFQKDLLPFLSDPDGETDQDEKKGKGLFQWSFNEIGTVFSMVPLVDWIGAEAEKNIEYLNWIGPRVCRHLEVIEEIMKHCPVFPLQFATLLASFQDLKNLTTHHDKKISCFLNFMQNREEWTLQGWFYPEKRKKHFISSFLSTPCSSPSLGLQYLLDGGAKIEIDNSLKSWLEKVNRIILKKLGGWVVKWNKMDIPSSEASEEDHTMVFHWALLLDHKNLEVIFFLMEEINREYSKEGLNLKITGPWPPYNFCPSLDMESFPH